MTTNYKLIGSRPKATIKKEYEKIPELKLIMLEIIDNDYKFWKDKGLNHPGIEKNIFLGKILKKIKITLELFEIATSELELEGELIQFQDVTLLRYTKNPLKTLIKC